MDPLKVLGLEPGATPEQAKVAWKSKLKEWHPDLNGNSEESVRRTKEINEAYEKVKDGAPKPTFEFDLGRFKESFERQFGTVVLNLRVRDLYAGFRVQIGPDDEVIVPPRTSPLRTLRSKNGVRVIINAVQDGKYKILVNGEDIAVEKTINLGLAVLGGKARVRMPDDSEVEVTVPPNSVKGLLRLKGKGLGEGSFYVVLSTADVDVSGLTDEERRIIACL